MFKLFALVFAAILAVAFAAPSPNPKPGVLAYAGGYVSPVAAYAAPAVATYGAAPVAYSAYSAPVAYPAYGSYAAPVAYY